MLAAALSAGLAGSGCAVEGMWQRGAGHRREGRRHRNADASKAELDAIKAKAFDGYASPKLGTPPVNFLADLDITGGNSGWPVQKNYSCKE